jgi:DnaJ-related protein SCJ1
MRFAVALLLFLALSDLFILHVQAGKDYYKILGVPRDATPKQIKKSYRELSLKYHPDKPTGDADKFAEISNAYEVLNDEDKRRTYDQYGEEGLKEGGRGSFKNPFDIFSSFGFGGGGGGGRGQAEQKKGANIEIPLYVTLKDLYLGKEMKVANKKQTLCPKCRGTGAKKADDVQTCPVCNGAGVRVQVQQLGPGFVTQTQTTCDKCGGKGKIAKSVCTACSGSKVATGEDKFTVVVERGMVENHPITFEQDADENPDVIPGDVIFRIKTLTHKRFTRKGDDLHATMTISLLEALVGFEKRFKHLDNHEVTIHKMDITKPGEIYKIEEEGMPNHNYPSQSGDMYIEFIIKMPSSLTEEQKTGIKDILGGSS